MEKITFTLMNAEGLHARPASLMTKVVKSFKSDIVFYKNNEEKRTFQAKSILSVMASGSFKGDQLTFIAEGEDEKAAIEAIAEFVQNGCGE